MADLLYIKPKQSVKVNERKVLLKDMAEIYSDNPDIAFAADKIEVYKFKEKGKKQYIISILDVVTTLTSMFSDVEVINLGEPDTIIYYEAPDSNVNVKEVLKFIGLCFIAFFGAAFSIMSYNSDVNLVGQLELMQDLFVGGDEAGISIAGMFYSIGLFLGIIIFFNHGAAKKFTDEPTPLQVQLRKYEQDVNQTIITDMDRRPEK